MGSRKKKNTGKHPKWLELFLKMDPHSRIAFKSYLYHYGRMRITLADLFRYPYFSTMSENSIKGYVHAGTIEWQHETGFYPSIKS